MLSILKRQHGDARHAACAEYGLARCNVLPCPMTARLASIALAEHLGARAGDAA